jgi:dienelactone hydrolase
MSRTTMRALPAPRLSASGVGWSVLAAFALLLAAGGAGCGATRHAHISVDHRVALWDVPLRISVNGLKPGEHAVLAATSRDATGKEYVSSTPVMASSAGRVELSGDAAMRVLWSLMPTGLGRGADFSYLLPSTGQTVRLSIGGAPTTLRRLTVAPGVRSRSVRRPFYGEYFAPASTTTQQPGILVLGGSEGGLSTIPIAQLYASHGYPALALAYFAEPGLPQNLAEIPLEYFANALRWLRKQPGVDPSKLAVEGISRGSEAAQLLGIHYPRLVHAVLAMVPANGPGCGSSHPTGGTLQQGVHCLNQAAWTFRGRAIPYGFGLYNLYRFHDERINGPIFLDCGGTDQVWPSCQMAHTIVARLRAHRFRHRIVLLAYPRAGHGVGDLVPNGNSSYSLLNGWNFYANDEAAAAGWPRLLGFLRALARS